MEILIFIPFCENASKKDIPAKYIFHIINRWVLPTCFLLFFAYFEADELVEGRDQGHEVSRHASHDL